MGYSQSLRAAGKKQVETKTVALADFDAEVRESERKQNSDESEQERLYQRAMKAAR